MSEISVVVTGSTSISSTVGNGDSVSVNVGDQTIGGGNGAAATIQVGTVTTLAPTASATVVNAGTSYAAKLDFSIPRGVTGLTGATGPANSLSIGSVSTGTTAAVSITGTAPSQSLAFVLPIGPQGVVGPAGPSAALSVGSVSTGATAAVTITGTSPSQVISFVIPPGPQGPQGNDGGLVEYQSTATHIQWRYVGGTTWTNLVALSAITGPSSTLTVGSVTTGATAAVSITGTAPSQSISFVLPPGPKGDTGSTGSTGSTGAAGPANSLSVGSVTTGSTAAVTITGSAPSQVVSFVIPPGPQGPQGNDGGLVEYQTTATHIQWRYVGGTTWTNLVALSAITGPAGPSGSTNLSDAAPSALGTAASGTSTLASRADHVHATPAISAISGLQTALDGKAGTTHTHTASQITDFATQAAKYGPVTSVNGSTGAVTVTGGATLSDATPQPLGIAAAGSSTVASRSDHVHLLPTISYTALSNVPTSFTPATHTHAATDVTSGTFASARLPLATSTAAGAVTIGTGLGVSSGVISASFSDTTPSALGTAAAGTSSLASRSDHVHALPTISYTALSNVPTSFTPAAHTQAASTISDFATQAALYGPVTSVATRTGAITLTKADVGLSAVDNVADASKPVSTAQAAADAAVQAYAIQRANHTGSQPASTITGLAAVATSGTYSSLTGIPSTFAPSSHTHAMSEVSGLLVNSYFPTSYLPRATTAAVGVVSVSTGLAVNTSGALSVDVAPGAPQSITDNGSGTISWTASTTGTSVTYEVQSTADSGATYVNYTSSTNDTFVVYIVLGGRKFRVRARNAAGVAGPWGYQSPLVTQQQASNYTVGAGLVTTDGTLYAAVQSVAGRTGTITLTNADVSGVVASNTTGITGSDAITNMVSLTAAEYAALGSKSVSTLYVIVG